MPDDKLNALVKKVYEESQCSTDQVFRVESDAAMDVLKKIIEGQPEYRQKIYLINYLDAKPFAAFVQSQEIRNAKSDMIFRGQRASQYRETAARAESLSLVFQIAEEIGQRPTIFIENPQEATVAQIKSLSALMVSMNNSNALPNCRLYFPGGDWYERPDFHATEKNDMPGGNLNYTRWRHFDIRYRNNDLAQTFEELSTTTCVQNKFSLNIHGEHFTGKTYLLEHICVRHSFVMSPYSLLITVYPKFAGEAGAEPFLTELQSRKVRLEKPLLIDNAERLAQPVITQLLQTYPRLVCTSTEPLTGFSQYVNTGDCHK